MCGRAYSSAGIKLELLVGVEVYALIRSETDILSMCEHLSRVETDILSTGLALTPALPKVNSRGNSSRYLNSEVYGVRVALTMIASLDSRAGSASLFLFSGIGVMWRWIRAESAPRVCEDDGVLTGTTRSGYGRGGGSAELCRS